MAERHGSKSVFVRDTHLSFYETPTSELVFDKSLSVLRVETQVCL